MAFAHDAVALRGREFQKKKATSGFSLLLPCCAWVLRLRLCGRRRQTVPSDDDVLNVVGYGQRFG